jgi:hypothetical protein
VLRIKIKFEEDLILRHVTTHETILNMINSSEKYTDVGVEERKSRRTRVTEKGRSPCSLF